MEAQWSDEEFKAYLMLYASQTNYNEDIQELNYIVSAVGKSTFDKIHTEILKDNDFQRIQKIISFIAFRSYSQDQLDALLEEIKSVYLSDGEFDILEQNMFRSLKKIMHPN